MKVKSKKSGSKLIRPGGREQLDSIAALMICALAAVGAIIIILIVFGYLVWKPL